MKGSCTCMTELVDPDRIEAIVGCKRHPKAHFARAVSAEQKVYILHSQECVDSGIDLRECGYSVALSHGIDHDYWEPVFDKPVMVAVFAGLFYPLHDTDYVEEEK